jgi:hypothetical protein
MTFLVATSDRLDQFCPLPEKTVFLALWSAISRSVLLLFVIHLEGWSLIHFGSINKSISRKFHLVPCFVTSRLFGKKPSTFQATPSTRDEI